MSLLTFVPKVTGSKLTQTSHYLQDDSGYYHLALRFESGKGHIVDPYDYDNAMFDELKDIDDERIKSWLSGKFKGTKNRPIYNSASFHFMKRRDDSYTNYCYYDITIGINNVGNHHSKLFEIFSNLDMREVSDWFNMKIDGINKKKPMPKKVKYSYED